MPQIKVHPPASRKSARTNELSPAALGGTSNSVLNLTLGPITLAGVRVAGLPDTFAAPRGVNRRCARWNLRLRMRQREAIGEDNGCHDRACYKRSPSESSIIARESFRVKMKSDAQSE